MDISRTSLARRLKNAYREGVIGRQVDGYIPPFQHDTQRRNLSVSLDFDAFSLVDCPWLALFGNLHMFQERDSRAHNLRHIPFS